MASQTAAATDSSRVVVISNGFGRFHLAVAAAEAHRRGALARLVTGAYPTPIVARSLGAIAGVSPSVARLLDRSQGLPPSVVTALWAPEIRYLFGRSASRADARRTESSTLASMREYANGAARAVRSTPASIYHYRAGYGGTSIDMARRQGMVVLCDYSIAHPVALEHYVDGLRGDVPRRRPRSRFWSWVLQDAEQADMLLANSDFVAATFIHQGWDPERIRVSYLGLDESFRRSLPESRCTRGTGPLRFLFAGAFGRRKGADTLVKALARLETDWSLEIAGSVEPALEREYPRFFADRRVRLLGTVPRPGLPEVMSRADIFVFPSRAEGSARVIFEALACGCYVITTPTAGSIVADGVHGRLVEPDNVAMLEDALRFATQDRQLLDRIGRANAEQIRTEYTQERYGDALFELYSELLERREGTA